MFIKVRPKEIFEWTDFYNNNVCDTRTIKNAYNRMTITTYWLIDKTLVYRIFELLVDHIGN